MRINGAQAVIECLKQEGVKVAFGYPGGQVLPLYDALYQAEFPHILTKHEQGAVHAADGYARSTAQVGVCIATSGPGATNLVTGIATANMDSIPLVCITGQVPTNYIGKDSFQEADVCGITTPITKHNYLIKKVEDLPRVFKEAFFIARTGRPGPVVIDIPKDIFVTEFEFVYPDTVSLKGYSGDFTGSAGSVAEVTAALRQSAKPLLFLGGGVNLSDTSEYVKQLAELTGMPVISSLMGMGSISSADDNHLGMVGMHGTYAANMATVECDLLLGVGVRFDDRVFGIAKKFAPNAKIAHFDIDAAEMYKTVRADYRVIGDLRWSLPLFIRQLTPGADELRKRIKPWRDKMTDINKRQPLSYDRQADCVMPQQIIETISELAEDDAIIVTDVGQHQMWAAQFYSFRTPRSFITSGGLGTMGYGLPAAIGAKLANPDRQVILITGDGSIMMNCQEFATAADYGVNVKVVLLNNHVLGMVFQWQRMFFGERYSQSRLNGKTDYVKLAEAMGATGYRVQKPQELKSVLKQMLADDAPVLVDIVVPETENVLPMVPAGASLDQMVLGGKQ